MGEVINLLDRKKEGKNKVEKLVVEFDWTARIKANKENQERIKKENLRKTQRVIRAFNLKKNK